MLTPLISPRGRNIFLKLDLTMFFLISKYAVKSENLLNTIQSSCRAERRCYRGAMLKTIKDTITPGITERRSMSHGDRNIQSNTNN